MILLTRFAWIALAAIHLVPALGLVSSTLRQRIYGIDPGGDLAILLSHRAVIVAAIVTASLAAATFDTVRPATAYIVSASVIGFLFVYALGGMPAGPLRQVALVDCAALPLLVIVWLDLVRR
jgi:hypothetical protein